jgi:hypothetical protein
MDRPYDRNDEEASSAMNVNGMGGAASLPMTLPSSSSHQAATGAIADTAGTTGTAGSPGTIGAAGQPTGDLRLPGQHPATPKEAAAKAAKEIPKPAPLPPLRGLTVAEIRAMLGVAPLTSQVEAAAAGLTPGAGSSGAPVTSAAFDRYA